MWSRTDQTKEKKPLKEDVSHQAEEACQIQMPVPTSASESIEVLHGAKRQRRPSVRLGEIGDLPAAFFTERRNKPTNVVSSLDPSKSKEKTLESETFTQDQTIDFESSRKATTVLEESNKVYIESERTNKETFCDSEGSKKGQPTHSEKSRSKDITSTKLESSAKEQNIFYSKSLRKEKSINNAERSQKRKRVVLGSSRKAKNIVLDGPSKAKSIDSKRLNQKSIPLERSKKENTIGSESVKKENTVDLEILGKETAIDSERNGLLEVRAKNGLKTDTASEDDVEGVQHTIRLADVTLCESSSGLQRNPHEESLANGRINHLMVSKKNWRELSQSSQGRLGKRNRNEFVSDRLRKNQSKVLSKDSSQSEQNMRINGHDSKVPKEICLDIRPNFRSTLGKRNPEESFKNVSINDENGNQICVSPPTVASVEKVCVDFQAFNSVANAEENVKDSGIYNAKEIMHSDDEENDSRTHGGFQDCGLHESDNLLDAKAVSDSGESDMDRLKPYEEDMSARISKELRIEQEQVKGSAADWKGQQGSSDRANARFNNREATPLQDGNGNEGPRESSVRCAHAYHYMEEAKRRHSHLLKDGVKGWLQGLGLSKYAEQFEEHEVDQEVLPLLTFDDLKEMGVMAVGSRRKLFDAIQQLARSLMLNTDQPPAFGP